MRRLPLLTVAVVLLSWHLELLLWPLAVAALVCENACYSSTINGTNKLCISNCNVRRWHHDSLQMILLLHCFKQCLSAPFISLRSAVVCQDAYKVPYSLLIFSGCRSSADALLPSCFFCHRNLSLHALSPPGVHRSHSIGLQHLV